MSVPVVLSIGSNLGDRRVALRRAVEGLKPFATPVRISRVYETEPVGCPPGSPLYLNLALLGLTDLAPEPLIARILETERLLGRRRRKRNDPRAIDIDLVLYGAWTLRSATLTVPHPRYAVRSFVLRPMREFGLRWVDPATGVALDRLGGDGEVRDAGPLY